MSTPQPAPPATSNAPKLEIPELGKGYRDARKLYTLLAALLFGWELIGLEISPEPIQSLKLTLKSPQAVPYVLIVLLFYFAFRFTVEWYQTSESRRSILVSRIDYVVSHAIAIAAVTLYVIQTLLKIQLANSPERLSSIMTGFGSPIAIWAPWIQSGRLNPKIFWEQLPRSFKVFVPLLGVSPLILAVLRRTLVWAIAGVLVGVAFIAFFEIYRWRTLKASLKRVPYANSTAL
jgi:hypothetical protein